MPSALPNTLYHSPIALSLLAQILHLRSQQKYEQVTRNDLTNGAFAWIVGAIYVLAYRLNVSMQHCFAWAVNAL